MPPWIRPSTVGFGTAADAAAAVVASISAATATASALRLVLRIDSPPVIGSPCVRCRLERIAAVFLARVISRWCPTGHPGMRLPTLPVTPTLRYSWTCAHGEGCQAGSFLD